MKTSCIALVALCVLLGTASATSIAWTGYANDNQWTTNNNWYPNSVPGPNDDVTIEKGNVICTIATAVRSINMGFNVDTAANLTLYKSFAVSDSLNVKGNGNLIVSSGLETVMGSVNIDGTLTFQSGFVSGAWTVSSRGKAYFPGAGQRNIVAGSFQNDGVLFASGVIALNQSARVVNTGSMTASAEFQVMVFDQTQVSFDSSKGSFTFSGTVMRVQVPATFGNITLSSGNIEVYNLVSFAGALSIPSGSKVATLGSSNVTFLQAVTGAGTFEASGAATMLSTLNNVASFVVSGGNTYVSQASTVTAMSVSGGTIKVGAGISAATLTVAGGIISGPGALTAATLQLGCIGANLDGSIVVTGKGSLTSASLLAFNAQGNLVIASSAEFDVASTLNITGAGNLGITNKGTLSVSGTVRSQNIPINGAGVLALKAGNVTLSSTTLSQNNVTVAKGSFVSGTMSSATVQDVSADGVASVTVAIGGGSVLCPGHCDSVSANVGTFKFSA